MAPKAVQMVCVALCAVGLIGVMTCCALPQWIVIHHHVMEHLEYPEVMQDLEYPEEVHAGLWMECQKDRTVLHGCRAYDSIMSLSAGLLVGRPMTIISCILGGLSLLLLVFGSDLIPCVQNEGAKTKMILVAGVVLLLAGLLVIIPVSRVAHDIKRNLNRNFVRVDLRSGASIYIGYLAGVLMILIGGLLSWLSSRRSSSSGGTASFFSNRV